MSPLIRRQYNPRTSRLTRTLRRCLVRWHSAAGALPPRLTPFRLASPFGAHSDAQGLWHIACRILLGSVSSYHVHLPPWFAHLATNTEGGSAIYLFGICASIFSVAVASEANTQPSRTCVLRIDNQAALAALVKGSTSSELGTVLVGVFWAFAARSSVYWRMEYVRTDSDDSDRPSRRCNADSAPQCQLQSGQIPESFFFARSNRGKRYAGLRPNYE